MIDNTEREEIETGWKTTYAIWISMLIALFVYLIVGLSLKNSVNFSIEEGTLKLLRYGLYALSIATFIAIRYVRSLILKQGIVSRRQGFFSSNSAVAKYTKATIVSLALAESIAIYGLVLFLLGKNTLDLYLLIFISAVAMIYYRPFKEQLIKLSNEMKGY